MTATAERPSITEQGFKTLPVIHAERDVRNYNSGCTYKGGRFYLATRRFDAKRHRCAIDINEIIGIMRVVRICTLELESATGMENFEDGRLFWHNGRLHIAYTEGNYFPPHVSTSIQKVAVLRDDWSVESTHTIAFGDNTVGHEKNWQFFSHEGRLFFVYSIGHHWVAEVSKDWSFATICGITRGPQWDHGTLSGGTPPVLVDGLFYSFFHSYQKHPNRQRIYSFSAYCFESKPPFRIAGITEPLIVASPHDRTLPNPRVPNWLPLVVFPCGALFDAEQNRWLVSAGVNDSDDVLFYIPHHELKFRSA